MVRSSKPATGTKRIPGDSDRSALEDRIRNSRSRRVKLPDMPIGIYLQEAADLYTWLAPDREQLIERGLDPAVIEELPRRIEALRRFQSRWNTVRRSDRESRRHFVGEAVAARDLMARLVHEFSFAYRRHPRLVERARAIGRESDDAHLIQGLSDLSVLGRNNPGPLAAVNFDMARLDEAAAASTSLASALAAARAGKAEDRKTKQQRDHAYTLLKEIVDEIREFGRFVFWREENRRRGYGSEYKRLSRSKRTPRRS